MSDELAAAVGEVELVELAPLVIRVPLLDEILRRWGEVEPLLRRATDRSCGLYEPEDVLVHVCRGVTVLHMIEAAGVLLVVVVTELRHYPRRRVIDVAFVGARPGDNLVRQWAPQLVAYLEEMARAAGAAMISGTGRIGWSRVAGMRLRGGYSTREVAPQREDSRDVERAKPNGFANGHEH